MSPLGGWTGAFVYAGGRSDQARAAAGDAYSAVMTNVVGGASYGDICELRNPFRVLFEGPLQVRGKFYFICRTRLPTHSRSTSVPFLFGWLARVLRCVPSKFGGSSGWLLRQFHM